MLSIEKNKALTLYKKLTKQRIKSAQKAINSNCSIYKEAVAFRMIGWPMANCEKCIRDKCSISSWVKKYDVTFDTIYNNNKNNNKLRTR